jgi:hypothetical protein
MRTFWLRDEEKRPVACVAVEGACWALSVHRPSDPFNKALGREWAMGRLQAYLAFARGRRPEVIKKKWVQDNFCGYFGTEEEDRPPFDLDSMIVEMIRGNRAIPQRVRTAAELWPYGPRKNQRKLLRGKE